MADPTLDATRIEAGIQALRDSPESARTLVMKWAVATVALQDLIRAKGNVEAPWPEVAAIAATWLEESGRGLRRPSAPSEPSQPSQPNESSEPTEPTGSG